MPKSAKKKGKAPKLTFYKAPHVENETSSITKHRYAQFSSDSSGMLSQSFSTLKMKKSAESSAADYGEDAGTVENVDEDNSRSLPADSSLDAAYIQHLEETASDDKIKRIRAGGDESLRDFVPQTDMFLEELIGLESRGCWPNEECSGCLKPGIADYQCLECWGRAMWCADCLVEQHAGLYLHRIQKWNGKYFEKKSLKSLGLRQQLGHPRGELCLNPTRCANDDFIIIHSNGMHEVGLDFCGCGKGNQLHTVQLLRARLFPATVVNPKTAATMEVLDLYCILSFESKKSVFQFYHSLSRITDNTGLNPPKDRYPSFLRMIHEWRHLMMLKRAGRGHDPGGAAATKEGECAVLCPACPQPGKNMMENWRERPEHLQFLDTLFIAIDANFRLKRKNVSNNEVDPGLSHGWSYFVEDTKYREHVKNHIAEVEPKSSCSCHEAITLSETKPGQGHAATGVGAVVCARHDIKRPRAVAQLQRGERYCNMDYIFHSTMKDSEVMTFVVSYDIVCQWSIHLLKRMENYVSDSDPDFFLFKEGTHVTFLVPKFHLPAHVAKCRTRFSFNLTKNVGRTEGEAPERGWVGPNALAPSTKEMGPGSCRDTLDVHFGDENHKKVIGLGASLLRKIMDAARNMAEHTIGHEQLESTISSSNIEEWTLAIEAWELDSSQPNPFENTTSGASRPTQAAVRRQLAENEHRLLEQGRDFALDDTVTPSVLISTGIDLENEQRVYKETCSKLWEHALDRQHTKAVLRGNTLIRKIEAWSKYQTLYMPAVAKLRDNDLRKLDHTVELKAHELSLWLPSQIRSQISVPEQYRRLEFELRVPQASEALDELRAQLQVRAHLFKFKDRFIRGQGANTRARNTLEGIQGRIDAAANEYRAAYAALLCLGSLLHETAWKSELLPLNNEDIRDLSEGKANQSEGKRDISWIWRKVALDRIDKPEEGHYRDGVRIEWAKSRARANQFTEEVLLLTEEMKRVQRFFEWKAQDWESKADVHVWQPSSMTPMHAEGLAAYANRQAGLYRSLISHFKFLWKDVPAHVTRMQAIIEDPSLAKPGEFDNTKAAKSKRPQ